MIETSIVQQNTRSFNVIISPRSPGFAWQPASVKCKLFLISPPGSESYVSVIVLERPEEFLSEGVQTGRHGERHHPTSSSSSSSGVGVRAPLDWLEVVVA